jgi:hypothetical protein
MLLPGRVDDAATASSAPSGCCPGSRSVLRDVLRVCRESLEQIRCAIPHTGELLLQRVAIHPARRFSMNGAGDSPELLGKCHDLFLQHVSRRCARRARRRARITFARAVSAFSHMNSKCLIRGAADRDKRHLKAPIRRATTDSRAAFMCSRSLAR